MKKVCILLLCVLLPLFPIGAKKKVRNSEIPILAWYSIPGGEYATVEHGRTCPLCGSENTWLLRGNEVEIKEIEV